MFDPNLCTFPSEVGHNLVEWPRLMREPNEQVRDSDVVIQFDGFSVTNLIDIRFYFRVVMLIPGFPSNALQEADHQWKVRARASSPVLKR